MKRIFFHSLILALCMGLSLPAEALLGRRKSYFTFSSFYSTYKDIKISPGESADPSSTADFEIGYKYYPNSYLLLVATKSLDNDRKGVGLGVRIDFPGFFYIGGRVRSHYRQKSKLNAVNTSGYIHMVATRTGQLTELPDTTVATRTGVTIEIFPFNKLIYTVWDISFYTLNGNSSVSYSVGLGIEL